MDPNDTMGSLWELWPVCAFFVMFFGVLGAMLALLLWVARRMSRAGGVTGVLLGGQSRSAGVELAVGGPPLATSSRLTVHRVEVGGEPAVGVVVTHWGPGFAGKYGFSMTPAQLERFVADLDAMARSSPPGPTP